jgi:hypothetical protein
LRRVLLAALPALAASPLLAGPWPRGEGQVFVSVGGLFSTGQSSVLNPINDLRFYGSVFAEYGLDENWTLGLDAAHGFGFGEEEYTALLTVRRVVARFDDGQIVGADLSVGWLQDSLDGGALRTRAGLSWGLGFESALGGGWMSLDTSAEWRNPGEGLILKADATLGLRPWDGFMVIGQIQTGYYPGSGTIVKLAPSVAWEIADGAHLQLGLSVALTGDDEVGVKLAQWFAF